MGEAASSRTTIAAPTEVILRLLKAGRECHDGLLSIRPRDGDGPTLHLRLEQGLLADFETEGEASLLGRALLASPSLRDRDRRRLQKDQAAGHGDAGQKAIEAGFLDEDEIARCIIEGLDQEFSRVLSFENPEIVQTSANAPLAHGLLGCIELSLPLGDAILRGATHADRWDVARELPLLREVYYATPEALEVFRQPEQYPEDAALLEQFDGRFDLAEVIESGQFEPWATIARVRSLAEDGFLAVTNPVQLFQMGCEEERLGALGKALRLFQHSDELGLDDFDLGYRLAGVLQRVGRTREALGHFQAFAEKCVGQFRIEDTIAAYAHILELDPENLAIQEKYLTLLARYGRSDEALASSVALARRLQESGDEGRARSLLEQVVEQADGNEEVLRLYRDLCVATADPDGASQASNRLGTLLLERGDLEAALEEYQSLFFQQQENATVRARLVELHFRLDRPEKAAEHLEALVELSGWRASHPTEEAITFHRYLLDLGVEDSRITAWLSEAARGKESREDSAHYLERHRDLLREAGDFEGARLAAAELGRLRPDDIEAARTLSDLERRCDHPARAGIVLEELVTRLAESESCPPPAQWRELLKELLSVAPLSSVARRHWLSILPDEGEAALRDRLLLECALLAVASGNLDEARAHIARMVPPPPFAPVLELCAGILSRGERQVGDDAATCFRRGAQQAAEGGDRGLLADLLDRLEAVSPDDPDLTKLRGAAERLRTPDAPSMGRSPRVVQGSVAGITEKLRGLKDTGPGISRPTPAPTAGGVHAALARLRGLQGGESPAAPEAPAPMATQPSRPLHETMGQAPLPPPPAPRAAGGGVNAALQRLKGLQGGGGGQAATAPSATGPSPTPLTSSTDGGSGPSPLPPPPPPEKAGGGVQSALAKLRGLQSTGSGPAPANPAPPAPAHPAPAHPAPPPSTLSAAGAVDPVEASPPSVRHAGGTPDLAPLPPPPAPEKGKKLGGAAAKLNALRDQK